MTTRRYISGHEPAFKPTLKGNWSTTANVVYRELAAQDAPSTSVSQTKTNASTTWNMALLCVVAHIDFNGVVANSTTPASIDLRYGRLASVASAFNAWVHVWVSTGATTTVRGTLVTNLQGGATWLTNAVYSFSTVTTGVGSDLAVTAGDYIVWEIGCRGITSSTTAVASLYWGGLAGPDPISGDAVTTQAGWADFAVATANVLEPLPVPGSPLLVCA